MSASEKPPAPYVLRVPCNDENAAQLFETYLNNEGVDTNSIDGQDVVIPWGGDARFAMAVAEAALEQGFAPDDLRPVLRQIEGLAMEGS